MLRIIEIGELVPIAWGRGGSVQRASRMHLRAMKDIRCDGLEKHKWACYRQIPALASKS
jgi:hypothetical protein